jgi:hypothetical protein
MGLVVVIIVSRSLRRFVWLDIVLECRVGESETSSQTLPASDDMGKGSLLYSICATALLFTDMGRNTMRVHFRSINSERWEGRKFLRLTGRNGERRMMWICRERRARCGTVWAFGGLRCVHCAIAGRSRPEA